jgi:hypothetical protein
MSDARGKQDEVETYAPIASSRAVPVVRSAMYATPMPNVETTPTAYKIRGTIRNVGLVLTVNSPCRSEGEDARRDHVASAHTVGE